MSECGRKGVPLRKWRGYRKKSEDLFVTCQKRASNDELRHADRTWRIECCDGLGDLFWATLMRIP
uniref:Uncharacterized protein n=1 Tax=Rhizobium loti TaxID=381 RepID=Q8KGP1_RHILI|nr:HYPOTHETICAL PROTEIN [Mesorhizobium japonicum R7A]